MMSNVANISQALQNLSDEEKTSIKSFGFILDANDVGTSSTVSVNAEYKFLDKYSIVEGRFSSLNKYSRSMKSSYLDLWDKSSSSNDWYRGEVDS